MIAPIFTVIAASFYFGWLWHGSDRTEERSTDERVNDSNRIE